MTPAPAICARASSSTAISRAAVHYGRTFDASFAPDLAVWAPGAIEAGAEGDEVDVLVTCGEDSRARVMRCDSRGVTDVGTCRGHDGEVLRVAFGARDGAFATASADGSCKMWRLGRASAESTTSGDVVVECVQTLDEHPGEVYGCCFMDDVKMGTIATCSETEVYCIDVETKTRLGASKREERDKENVAASTPDRWSPGYLFSMTRSQELGVLACGCSDGAIRVYSDGARGGGFGDVVAVATPHPNAIVGTTMFIDDGRVLASVGLDGTIALTDTRTWGMFRRISSGTPLMSACGIGGGWLGMVGSAGVVRAIDAVYDEASPACVFIPPVDPLVPLFCVSANARGTRLACAGAGVPVATPALAAAFGVKRPDPSRLDVWTVSRDE